MTMGQQVLYSRRAATVLVVWLSIQCAAAVYNDDSGYVCTPSQSPCETFVLYRAQESYSSIQTIASLFEADQSKVATINKMSEDVKLWNGDALFVPITCVCNDTLAKYAANVTYTIANGDTFEKIAMVSFESLSTKVAIQNTNPGTNATQLVPLESLIVPVRCSCPNTTEQTDSVSALVTYPVVAGDSVDKIGSEFGVASSKINTANDIAASDLLIAPSTLLIPIKTDSPTFKATGSSAPASGFSTGAYIRIAVAGLSVLVTGMLL